MSLKTDELFFLDLPVFYQEKKEYIQRLNEIVLDREKTTSNEKVERY
jgi:hypothetical protein